MIRSLFLEVVNMSIAAGIAVLAVLFVRQAGKRFFGQWASYLLWSVVLIRLLVPLSFGSPLSLFNLVAPASAESALGVESPVSTMAFLPRSENSATPSVEPATQPEPQDVGTAGGFREETHPPFPDAVPETEQPKTPAPAPVPTKKTDWVGVLSAVWLSGAGLILISSLCFYAVTAARLRHARTIDRLAALNRCKKAVGVQRKVKLAVSGVFTTPVVSGVFFPKIVLPRGFDLSDELLTHHILTHELVHIRRWDNLVKIISLLALSLHWFNPLVWAAFRISAQDMESSCDEWVVRLFGPKNRSEYAESLLLMASRQNQLPLTASFLAFGESNLKKRVKSIMKYRKRTVLSVGAALLAVLLVGCSVLTNPSSSDPRPGGESDGVSTPDSSTLELPPPVDNTAATEEALKSLHDKLYLSQADANALREAADADLRKAAPALLPEGAVVDYTRAVESLPLALDYIELYEALQGNPDPEQTGLLDVRHPEGNGWLYNIRLTDASGQPLGSLDVQRSHASKTSADYVNDFIPGTDALEDLFPLDDNLQKELRACPLDFSKTKVRIVSVDEGRVNMATLLYDGARSFLYFPEGYRYRSNFFHARPTEQSPVLFEGKKLYSTEDFLKTMGLCYGNRGGSSLVDSESWAFQTLSNRTVSQEERGPLYLYNNLALRLEDYFRGAYPENAAIGFSMGILEDKDGFYYLSPRPFDAGIDSADSQSLYLHRVDSDGFGFEITGYAALPGPEGGHTMAMGYADLGKGYILYGKLINGVPRGTDGEYGDPIRYDKLTLTLKDGTSMEQNLRNCSYFAFQVPEGAEPDSFEFTDFTGKSIWEGSFNGPLPTVTSGLIPSGEIANWLYQNYQGQYKGSEYSIWPPPMEGDYVMNADGKTYPLSDPVRKTSVALWLTGYSPMVTDSELAEIPKIDSAFTADFTIEASGVTIEFCEKDFSAEPDRYRTLMARADGQYYYYSYDNFGTISINDVLRLAFLS